ncbi:hypothetical protein R3P38DRAFT_2661999 [Favolaschia claudopus]|uniref:Uncharacterized protein n=1 Tax=Favolaschia claudopus TaxID=2862362 RepID=A0AAV9ZKR6_9AGAR
MPTDRTYACKKCPLNHNRDHRVLKDKRVNHNADIAAHKRQSSSPAAERAVDAGEATAGDADAELDRLASLLTGLVVVDDGAPPRNQMHSKLFSSREDFQSDAPHVPTAFTPIPPSQALESCEALTKAHFRPSALQAKENDTVLLQEMRQRIRDAREELDFHRALQATAETIPSLTKALDVATSVVIEAGRLLESIKAPPSKRTRKSPRRKSHILSLETLLQSVTEEANALDVLVDVVGHLLPTSLDEVFHDAAHHFEDPISKYSLVAQLSILLAVICHVVIGVSTVSTDFIIALVNMIIRSAMAICSPGRKNASATQEHVLKQLPTSLEAALRRFKIDPATTIYATCPYCHHTHEPVESRLTGEASYPETCQGWIYPDRGPRTPCGKNLLEQRQGKLRPIKPYVFTSFVDYIAAMLSDAEVERMCEAACDNALAAVREALSKDPDAPVSEERVNNVFEAEFLRSFEGPVPDQLFIQRDGRMQQLRYPQNNVHRIIHWCT